MPPSDQPDTDEVFTTGGCHCQRIRFRARGVPKRALVCNCSICRMKGYVHWIVRREDFELLSGQDELSTYRFHTKDAKHHFCSVCGIAPFYIARSDPGKIDVNARCLDDFDIDTLERVKFDGANWERAYEQYDSS